MPQDDWFWHLFIYKSDESFRHHCIFEEFSGLCARGGVCVCVCVGGGGGAGAFTNVR